MHIGVCSTNLSADRKLYCNAHIFVKALKHYYGKQYAIYNVFYGVSDLAV